MAPNNKSVARTEQTVAAKKEELSAVRKPWRPWPWNYLPDQITAILGVLIVLPVAPFMGVLIGTAEITWHFILFVLKHFPIHLYFRAKIVTAAKKLGEYILKDKRNYSFIPHIFWLSLWAPFLMSIAIYRFYHYGFELWFFFAYHFLRIGPRFRFFAHLHVLVHREGHDHKGFFKGPMSIFNWWICQWWVGPFYGQVPNSYGMAHNKIHHRYDNDLGDVHTNFDLDRSTLYSFFVYLPRFAFYWLGISPFVFFLKMREWRFLVSLTAGMAYHAMLIIVAAYFSPLFSLEYFVYPIMEDIIFFGGISYLWHAFLNTDDPDNQYVNSMTILNGKDNIWNEDYHVVHHTSPMAHWSDYPQHFEDRKKEYARSKATIFQDTEEGELLFLMLAGKFDKMAEYFVDLDGKMTHEEKLELVKKRLQATLQYKCA